jgi:uncharacterized membrane protein
MGITADMGLIFAFMCAILCGYFYITGEESINLYNTSLIMFSSILGMLCWLVGQNACVRGVAGPALAIMYTGCFVTTLLQVIFLGLIPTVY